jgi:hypothetical protein
MRAAKLAAAVLLAAFLAQPAYAQPFPESDRQTGADALRNAEEKAADLDYKAAMKRTPNTTKKVDPWGGLRTTLPG